MTEQFHLSRISSFGLGVSLSAVATTCVTMSYVVGQRIHTLDVPILFDMGLIAVGAGTILYSAVKPKAPAPTRRRKGSRLEP